MLYFTIPASVSVYDVGRNNDMINIKHKLEYSLRVACGCRHSNKLTTKNELANENLIIHFCPFSKLSDNFSEAF